MIFKYSRVKGILPAILRNSIIIPSHKVPIPPKLEDYRPIHILSTLSKLFEIIIQEQMVELLTKKKFFSNDQFVFQPKQNTSEAVHAHILEIV